MDKEILALIGAWFQKGFITDEVDDLFRLVGKELTTRDLKKGIALTQTWLRGKDEHGKPLERWQIPQPHVHEMARLKSVMRELGLLDAMNATDDRMHFDVIVVLGATLMGMRSRVNALVEQDISCDHLVALACLRPINPEEQAEFTRLGLDPAGKTEADAALIAFNEVHMDKLSRRISVIATPDPTPGKRPTTDETLVDLKNQVLDKLPDGASVLIVSHVPSGLRQAMTVRRVLGAEFQRLNISFTFGKLAKPLEEITGVVLDEACRILFEIGKLPPELIAQPRSGHICCNCSGAMLDGCARMQTCICQETCDGHGNVLPT